MKYMMMMLIIKVLGMKMKMILIMNFLIKMIKKKKIWKIKKKKKI